MGIARQQIAGQAMQALDLRASSHMLDLKPERFQIVRNDGGELVVSRLRLLTAEIGHRHRRRVHPPRGLRRAVFGNVFAAEAKSKVLHDGMKSPGGGRFLHSWILNKGGDLERRARRS